MSPDNVKVHQKVNLHSFRKVQSEFQNEYVKLFSIKHILMNRVSKGCPRTIVVSFVLHDGELCELYHLGNHMANRNNLLIKFAISNNHS